MSRYGVNEFAENSSDNGANAKLECSIFSQC